MPYNPISYGTDLFLSSEEIIKVESSVSLRINEVDTFNSFTITNPGNISPTTWRIDCKIRKDSADKYNLWVDLFKTRPLETLTIFRINYFDVYFTDLSTTITDLDPLGDILFFDATLQFLHNVNF